MVKTARFGLQQSGKKEAQRVLPGISSIKDARDGGFPDIAEGELPHHMGPVKNCCISLAFRQSKIYRKIYRNGEENYV